MNDRRIHIVIPTFNRKAHLLRCLQCLCAQDVALSIFVSDSGSTDGTVEAVSERFPEVTVLAGHADLWWTGAIGLGLSHVRRIASGDDFFLLLNDDTEFDTGFVSRLLDATAANPHRIVGAVCTDQNAPDVVVDGGTVMNWWTARSRVLNEGRSLKRFPPGYIERVSVLSGRGALYPVSVLQAVGMPAVGRLPHYAADYEFSRRCAAAGFELVVAYDAVVRGDLRATGLHAPASRLSLAAAKHFFFSRRSACNLVDRFHFSCMTARNPLSGTVFYLCTLARLFGRYVRAQRSAP